MPIKDPSKYPPDWPEIRRRVLLRAGDRCECEGECGHDHGGRCGAPNGARIYWVDHAGKVQWRIAPKRITSATKIVLTTAHLDHALVNHDDTNLKAMCQRCHLAFDRRARQAAEDDGRQLTLDSK